MFFYRYLGNKEIVTLSWDISLQKMLKLFKHVKWLNQWLFNWNCWNTLRCQHIRKTGNYQITEPYQRKVLGHFNLKRPDPWSLWSPLRVDTSTLSTAHFLTSSRKAQNNPNNAFDHSRNWPQLQHLLLFDIGNIWQGTFSHRKIHY